MSKLVRTIESIGRKTDVINILLKKLDLVDEDEELEEGSLGLLGVVPAVAVLSAALWIGNVLLDIVMALW